MAQASFVGRGLVRARVLLRSSTERLHVFEKFIDLDGLLHAASGTLIDGSYIYRRKNAVHL